MKKKNTIILGVSASIAIYKACDLIRKLKAEGFVVKVVMTPDAKELIRPIVFQALSGNQVYEEMFGRADNWEIEHISLAQDADLVLLAPATANIIGKVASGISDNLLTCIISATKAKVIFCPAMNENMYQNKITQVNIAKLKALGYGFVGPVQGKLACGKSGIGCLAAVDEIVKAVKKNL